MFGYLAGAINCSHVRGVKVTSKKIFQNGCATNKFFQDIIDI